MNTKGSVSFYMVFLYTAILIVIITAVFAPLGTNFGTEFYSAGADILNDSQENIRGLSDPDIKKAINDSLVQAQANQELNIKTNADIYKYGWIILIGLVAIGFFLYSRRINEVRGFS